MGLLLWGQTEGNPDISPLFSIGYGVDRLLISFTLYKQFRYFIMFRAGADTATIPHSSKPSTLVAIIKHSANENRY